MNSTLTAWEQEAFPHRRSSGMEARSWLLLVFAASVGGRRISAGLPKQFLGLFGEPFLFMQNLYGAGDGMGVDEQTAYQMMPAEPRALQIIQCELIAEVDRICKKCGIKSNMVGGTMLVVI